MSPEESPAQIDVAELLARVDALTTRVAELEARLDAHHPPGELSDDVILAISAACAAYLGHRAKVRAVRLRRPSTWTTEGRSDVQHQRNLY